MKIENPKLEIRNKLKGKIQIQINAKEDKANVIGFVFVPRSDFEF